jgi:hypothetical protein
MFGCYFTSTGSPAPNPQVVQIGHDCRPFFFFNSLWKNGMKKKKKKKKQEQKKQRCFVQLSFPTAEKWLTRDYGRR